jgi:cold shock CspA family protein
VAQGVVKVYDPVTGVGIIVTEVDKSEVFLRPGSL